MPVEFKKIQDYLYEATYEDYDWEAIDKYFEYQKNNKNLEYNLNFMCSSFIDSNKKFTGRNLDLPTSHMCEFIIHTPNNPRKNRLATLTICSGIKYWTQKYMDNNLMDDINRNFLPFKCLEGINEKGVYIATLVVSPSEINRNMETINPTSLDKLSIQFIQRFVLDNAISAENAIELLRQKRIVCDKEKDVFYYKEGYEPHYHIADKDKSYIVEFVGDQMNVKENDATTNFYLTIPELTEHPTGFERYEILTDLKNNIQNQQDVLNALEQVKYTRSYDFQNTYKGELKIFKSECYNKYPINKGQEIIDVKESTWELYKDKMKNVMENVFKEHKERPKDYSINCWRTLHSSAYDLENKKLLLSLNEDFENLKEFEL